MDTINGCNSLLTGVHSSAVLDNLDGRCELKGLVPSFYSLFFGSLIINKDEDIPAQTVRITNVGRKDIGILSVKIARGLENFFLTGNTVYPKVLRAGESFTISVGIQFNEIGRVGGSIEIDTNEDRLPYSIGLGGRVVGANFFGENINIEEIEGRWSASLQEERWARINGDSAEAGYRLTLAAQLRGETEARVMQEYIARVTAFEAEALARLQLDARVGNNTARVENLQVAYANQFEAEALARQTLEANVNNRTDALFVNERIAYADRFSAASSERTALEARVRGYSEALIQEERLARADQNGAEVQARLAMQAYFQNLVASTYADEIIARSTADEAMVSRLTTMEASFNSGNMRGVDETARASIINESEARANADLAEATARQVMETFFLTRSSETNARIDDEQYIRSTADEALAVRTSITEAKLSFTQPSQLGNMVVSTGARVDEEIIARSTADGAQASRITVIEANYQTASQVDGRATVIANAKVLEERNARVTAIAAEASRVDGLLANYTTTTGVNAQISAAIQDEALVRSGADGALTVRINNAESEYRAANQNRIDAIIAANARITEEETTRAGADGALTTRISSAESEYRTANSARVGEISSNLARIIAEETTRANAISAEATRVNGLIAQINNDASGYLGQARIARDESVTAKNLAEGAAALTSTNVTLTANARLDTIRLSRNEEFDQGVAGWQNSAHPIGNAATQASYTWNAQTTFAGRAGVLVMKVARNNQLYSDYMIPVRPGGKYRFELGSFIENGTGTSHTYAGYVCYGADGQPIANGNSGHNYWLNSLPAAGSGWVDDFAIVSYEELMWVPGTTHIRTLTFQNYDDNRTLGYGAVSHLRCIDVTESQTAKGFADASLTSSGTASAKATEAAQSAAASLADRLLAQTARTDSEAARTLSINAKEDALSAASNALNTLSLVVNARLAAARITRNENFDAGTDGWRNDTTGTPASATWGAGSSWGRNNVLFTLARRGILYADYTIPLRTGGKYRFETSYRLGGTGNAQNYIGFQCLDANNLDIGSNSGHRYWYSGVDAVTGNWIDRVSAVLSASDTNWFPAGTVSIRPLAFLNEINETNVVQCAIDYLRVIDETEVQQALGYATAANQSAGTALAEATLAGQRAEAANLDRILAQTARSDAQIARSDTVIARDAAQGFASSAQTNLNLTVEARRIGVAAASASFPADMAQGEQFFVGGIVGAATNPNLGLPSNIYFVDEPGVGKYMRIRMEGAGYYHIRTRSLLPAIPHRTYRIEARARFAGGPGASTFITSAYGLGADYQELFYGGYAENGSTQHYNPLPDGWVDGFFEFTVPASPGCPWIAPNVYFQTLTATAANPQWVDLIKFKVTDVTSERAAQTSATVAQGAAADADAHRASAASNASLTANFRSEVGKTAAALFPRVPVIDAYTVDYSTLNNPAALDPRMFNAGRIVSDTGFSGLYNTGVWLKSAVPYAPGKTYRFTATGYYVRGPGESPWFWHGLGFDVSGNVTWEGIIGSAFTMNWNTTVTRDEALSLPSGTAYFRIGILTNRDAQANPKPDNRVELSAFYIDDVTSEKASQASAVASAGSATTADAHRATTFGYRNEASTFRNQSEDFRNAAEGFKNTSETQAGLAASSKTLADQAAALATSQQQLTAGFYKAAVRVAGDPEFDNGGDGWNWQPSGVSPASQLWDWTQGPYVGRRNVMVMKTVGNRNLYADYLLPVKAGGKYRFEGSCFVENGTGGSMTYFGFQCIGADGLPIGGNGGHEYWFASVIPAGNGWGDFGSIVWDYSSFRAGTTHLRLLTFQNYSNNTGLGKGAVDYIRMIDVTESERASSFATVASNQAAIATEKAAAATASTLLSASMSGGSLVVNPFFRLWPTTTSTPNIPTGWSDASNGASRFRRYLPYEDADQIGTAAVLPVAHVPTPDAANTSILQRFKAQRGNYTVRFRARLYSGSWIGAGVLLAFLNSSGVIIGYHSSVICQTMVSDYGITGASHGVNGNRVVGWEQMCPASAVPADTVAIQVYCASNLDFGGGTAAKDLVITECSVTPAGVIGTLEGSIANEAVVRANADGVMAGQINTITTTVGGHTASINAHSSSINGLLLKQGVRLDSNGYVTGYEQMNNGTSGSFIINADNFEVRKPGGGARTEYSNGNWRTYYANGQLATQHGVW